MLSCPTVSFAKHINFLAIANKVDVLSQLQGHGTMEYSSLGLASNIQEADFRGGLFRVLIYFSHSPLHHAAFSSPSHFETEQQTAFCLHALLPFIFQFPQYNNNNSNNDNNNTTTNSLPFPVRQYVFFPVRGLLLIEKWYYGWVLLAAD